MRINPFLIYIIIAGIGSIIKMIKKAQEDSGEKRPASMSGQEFDPMMEMEPLDDQADDRHYTSYDADLFEEDLRKPEPVEKRRPKPVLEMEEMLDQKKLEHLEVKQEQSKLRTQQSRGREERAMRDEARREKRKRLSRKEETSALKPELSPENLMQGVIMAEILQPPRAKRPYRPIYMDRD